MEKQHETCNTKKLDYLKLAVTYKCNLDCRFCQQQEEEKKDMSWESFEKVFENNEITKNLRLILFTGGEPLVWPHLSRAVKYCKDKGVKEIGIFTNGVLLSDKKIKELKNIGVDWIRISIYGADEKENDQFLRHTKSFEKIINALEKLKENGFKRKVRITIMKPNVNNIEDLTQKLYNMGVEEIDFRPYNPTLNPKANEEFNLSKEEFNTVIPLILKLREKMQDITQIKLLPGSYEFLYGKELPEESAVAKCQCGRAYLGVSAKGDIRICFGLHDNIGNIEKNDLLDVWQENKLLKEIRKCEVGDDCNECIFKKYCKTSDCFAIKLNIFGHLNKKNTACPLPYPLTSITQWKLWQKVNNII